MALHPIVLFGATVEVLPDTYEEGGPLVALAPVAFAAVLAGVHVFAGRLRFLDVVPRSRWLSLSGGVAVAYVFVHLLPELQRAGTAIDESNSVLVGVQGHVYLVALAGFTVFYGLERFVRQAPRRADVRKTDSPDGVFWLHVGSFGGYNALVGYLLVHQEEPGLVNLATFALAMALHFVVNDYGLGEHHGLLYRRYGRWMLAGAVFGGLAIGSVTVVHELLVAVLFAFLGGSIILNVIKEELPSERESRFWAFATGAVGYTVVLLLA